MIVKNKQFLKMLSRIENTVKRYRRENFESTFHRQSHVIKACFRDKNEKRRHAKTRQMVTFRVFAWRLFAPPHESTRHSMSWVFGYWLSYLCLAGERLPCENPPKSPFGGVSGGNHSRFRPENTLIRHGTNQPP